MNDQISFKETLVSKVCEKCKKEIPETLDYCPTCKMNELKKNDDKRSLLTKMDINSVSSSPKNTNVLIILVCVIIVGVIVYGGNQFLVNNNSYNQPNINEENNNDENNVENNQTNEENNTLLGNGYFESNLFSLEFSRNFRVRELQDGFSIMNGEDWEYDFKIDIVWKINNENEFNNFEQFYNYITLVHEESDELGTLISSIIKVDNHDCILNVGTTLSNAHTNIVSCINIESNLYINFIILDFTYNAQNINELYTILETVRFNF